MNILIQTFVKVSAEAVLVAERAKADNRCLVIYMCVLTKCFALLQSIPEECGCLIVEADALYRIAKPQFLQLNPYPFDDEIEHQSLLVFLIQFDNVEGLCEFPLKE